jgi:hypothetical protein
MPDGGSAYLTHRLTANANEMHERNQLRLDSQSGVMLIGK